MRSLILFLIAIAGTAFANPGWVPANFHVMVGENVVLDVVDNGAYVTGNYFFRLSPMFKNALPAGTDWNEVELELPVVFDETVSRYDDAKSMAQPMVSIKQATYLPYRALFSYSSEHLPAGVRLGAFYFRILRNDAVNDVCIQVQYFQPAVHVGDSDIVYYVPFLPLIKTYKDELGLREDAFCIQYISSLQVPFDQYTSDSERIEAPPATLSFRPKNRVPIGVRIVRKPNKSVDPTTTAVTPPAGQEPRHR